MADLRLSFVRTYLQDATFKLVNSRKLGFMSKRFSGLSLGFAIVFGVNLMGCGGSTDPIRPTDEMKVQAEAQAEADRAAMEAAGAGADLANPGG